MRRLVDANGPDIVVKQDPKGGSVATWKGDKRKPRPVGHGATWMEAVRDLRQKGTVH